ncbi:hypothetical protein NP233_g6800 [Leucocoprinus birnbaumii]|uniref:Protein kinase domain-containing protein n=1 Tax=Leucocoprinus birnbaumii TaxID=56174 RepID=A0AAD5YPP1_9AGAR|nr:hypothetical protein NP233_g6800 [Leucocoprinus birnbaumii]
MYPAYSGGYADVWIGSYAAEKDTKVAIKVLRLARDDPAGIQQVKIYLIRETLVWVNLKHPNVLGFFGLADDLGREGCPALISPFCENGPIMSYLKCHPEPSEPVRLRMMAGVAEGLIYLHNLKENIIHGDLKPSNILVSDDGQALLCDFGRSQIATHGGFTTKASGAVRYQAPEVFTDAMTRLNEAVDVYSFGISCSEIWTGVVPYPDLKKDPAVIIRVMEGRRPPCHEPASTMTRSLWQLFEQCWRKEPVERISMNEVVRHVGSKLGCVKEHEAEGLDTCWMNSMALNTLHLVFHHWAILSRGLRGRGSAERSLDYNKIVKGMNQKIIPLFLQFLPILFNILILPTELATTKHVQLRRVPQKGCQIAANEALAAERVTCHVYDLIGLQFRWVFHLLSDHFSQSTAGRSPYESVVFTLLLSKVFKKSSNIALYKYRAEPALSFPGHATLFLVQFIAVCKSIYWAYQSLRPEDLRMCVRALDQNIARVGYGHAFVVLFEVMSYVAIDLVSFYIGARGLHIMLSREEDGKARNTKECATHKKALHQDPRTLVVHKEPVQGLVTLVTGRRAWDLELRPG